MHRDRLVQVGWGLLVAVAIPYCVPRLGGAGLRETYGDFWVDVPLITYVILLTLGAARAARGNVEGRRFWYLVSGAMGCWLAARAFNIAWLLKLPVPSVLESDLSQDMLYGGFYLLLTPALEMQPHRSSPRPYPAVTRMVKAAGAIVFVFLLVAYFVIIPQAVNRRAYDTWVPSLLLYVTLDGYLTIRLASLRRARPGAPWNLVYGWMLVTAGLWMITDAFEALSWGGGVRQVRSDTLLDLLWLPAFGSMMLAVRAGAARPWDGAEHRETIALPAGRDPLANLWGGPVVLYAPALPLLHFGLYGLGVLDPVSRAPREALSVAAIAALTLLAWVYQRGVEWENLRLAADLRALVGQLRPHFLLNALNSLLVVLRRDPAAAADGLVRLGELLQYVLRAAGPERMTLARQWQFTSAYLELERLRLGERLSLQLELDETAGACLVPPMILQPLAENAVRHALGARAGGGRIEVRAWTEDGTLCLVVKDDGPGADPAAVARSPGLGLRAVRAQLEAYYGRGASLEVDTAPREGFQVKIRLPADAD